MNSTAIPTALLIACAFAFGLAACGKGELNVARAGAPQVEAQPADEQVRASAEVERGKYIVNTSGCHDCHTPQKPGPRGAEPDMSRMLSGHPEGSTVPAPPNPSGPWIVSAVATNTAWSGPWGVSFTANLTPDPVTGTGTWTRRNFIDTIRNGRHLGAGRALLPPMPVMVYAQLTDADLGAVFAYLRTVPPISNRVPPPRPPRSSE